MSGKPDLWMPFFIGDYLADTMHLTTEQHGTYILLLFAYWRNGTALQDNDESLAATCRLPFERWKQQRPIIEKFFQIKRGFWHHKRVVQEMNKARTLQNSLSLRGKSGAAARWTKNATANATANAQAMRADAPSHSHIPSTTPRSKTHAHSPKNGEARISYRPEWFADFWKAYPKKKSKGQAIKAWDSLKPPPELVETIVNYLLNAKWPEDQQYIKHPATWLNARCWEDQATEEPSRMGQFHI